MLREQSNHRQGVVYIITALYYPVQYSVFRHFISCERPFGHRVPFITLYDLPVHCVLRAAFS